MFAFWYHVPEFPKDPSAAQACLGKCTAVALCGVLLKWILLPRRLTAQLWCIWKLTMESCRQWNPNCHLVGVMSLSAAVHSSRGKYLQTSHKILHHIRQHSVPVAVALVVNKNQGATSRVLKLGQCRNVINCSSLKEVSPPRPAMIRLHFRAEISSCWMLLSFFCFLLLLFCTLNTELQYRSFK